MKWNGKQNPSKPDQDPFKQKTIANVFPYEWSSVHPFHPQGDHLLCSAKASPSNILPSFLPRLKNRVAVKLRTLSLQPRQRQDSSRGFVKTSSFAWLGDKEFSVKDFEVFENSFANVLNCLTCCSGGFFPWEVKLPALPLPALVPGAELKQKFGQYFLSGCQTL